MGTTSPDNIRFPDGLFPVNISADLENLAEDVQNALIKGARSGTSSERTTMTSIVPDGSLWQDTNGIRMLWRKQGSTWVPAVWRWGGTTTQMNSFTQAPVGFEWYNTTTQDNYIRKGGSWVLGQVRASGWIQMPATGILPSIATGVYGTTLNVLVPYVVDSSRERILLTMETIGNGWGIGQQVGAGTVVGGNTDMRMRFIQIASGASQAPRIFWEVRPI